MPAATRSNVFEHVMGNLLGLEKDSPAMRALRRQGYDSIPAVLQLSPSKVDEYYDLDDAKNKVIVPNWHKNLLVSLPVFKEYRAMVDAPIENNADWLAVTEDEYDTFHTSEYWKTIATLIAEEMGRAKLQPPSMPRTPRTPPPNAGTMPLIPAKTKNSVSLPVV